MTNSPTFEKPKIKCVIYDCDGVLFDSLEANGRLYEDICAALGRPPLKQEGLNYVHAHTVFEAIHFISGDDEALEKKALDIWKGIDIRQYIPLLKMEPHLLQTLERLREKGIKTAVSTNRTTSMKYVMEYFNLWPLFDMVVTALDVKHPKPHPESVEKILEAFYLHQEEVLFVGDSEVDQKTAESSGVRFVAYKNRTIPNDALIEDHLELLGLIEL
jgi:HAD superfamily hydrolase (TIGR01509 family)